MTSSKNDQGRVTDLDRDELDAVVGGSRTQREGNEGGSKTSGPGTVPDIILIEDPDL